MTQEDLLIMYRTNDIFHEFVDSYIRSNPEYSVIRALRMKPVKEKAVELLQDDRK